MGLRYKKANVTHPELKVTVQLPIIGVKKNPSNPMYTQLGVLSKGTIIECNVSELGLVTAGGKVVWGKYAQVNSAMIQKLLPPVSVRLIYDLDHQRVRERWMCQCGLTCLDILAWSCASARHQKAFEYIICVHDAYYILDQSSAGGTSEFQSFSIKVPYCTTSFKSGGPASMTVDSSQRPAIKGSRQ